MKKLLVMSILALVISIAQTGVARAALPECVDHDNTCTINGTECCDYPQYKCQGTFPNTTCQPASE